MISVYVSATITIALYILVALFSVRTIARVKNSHKKRGLSSLLVIFLSLNIMMALIFIYIQAIWSFAFSDIHREFFLIWTTFNIINGIAHLAFVQAIRVYLDWHHVDHKNMRRRYDDE